MPKLNSRILYHKVQLDIFITFRGQIMAEFGAGKLKIIGL